MRRIVTASTYLLVAALLAAPSAAQSQVRGKDLYDLMGRTQLVTTTGSFRVEWLPNGGGMLVDREEESAGRRFYAVDPVSEAETPFFTEAQDRAIREQYATMTGNGTDGLPFDRFTLVADGAALTFEHDGRHFHFDRNSNTLRELLRPEIEHQPYSDDLMRGMQGSQLWNGSYDDAYTRFAYVKGYDLYVTETATGSETQLTDDGSLDTFNGRPNWVYPEEFGQRDAY